MKVTLTRISEPYHFEARNEAGNVVQIDAGSKNGGPLQGAGPMQLVAMGLAGCSGIDVIDILNKSRQQVDGIDIEVDAQRATDQVPAVFTDMHVHYALTGDIDPGKARRACELSLGKYCSVSKMLEKTATITFSFSINGERYEQF